MQNFMASYPIYRFPKSSPESVRGRMPEKSFLPRACRGKARECFSPSSSRTCFFWKQPQNVANKINFRKIRLCTNTEPPLHTLKTRQCSWPLSKTQMRCLCAQRWVSLQSKRQAGKVLGKQNITASLRHHLYIFHIKWSVDCS